MIHARSHSKGFKEALNRDTRPKQASLFGHQGMRWGPSCYQAHQPHFGRVPCLHLLAGCQRCLCCVNAERYGNGCRSLQAAPLPGHEQCTGSVDVISCLKPCQQDDMDHSSIDSCHLSMCCCIRLARRCSHGCLSASFNGWPCRILSAANTISLVMSRDAMRICWSSCNFLIHIPTFAAG